MDADDYFQLRGKVVLITGASSGIGARTAVEFAKRGSKVALTGRNRDKLDQTAASCKQAGLPQDHICICTGDLRQEADLKKIAEETIEKLGTIHVLVNNAGGGDGVPMSQSSRAELTDMFEMNVLAQFTLIQFALPELIKHKGAVVNVSSIGGTRPHVHEAAYSVAKAAQDQMTRLYALDLAAKGVRFCSVNPGVTRTQAFDHRGGQALDKMFENMATMHPLGRVGDPREIAQSIVFLASNAASFITGVNLPIGGGLNITMMQPRDGWPAAET